MQACQGVMEPRSSSSSPQLPHTTEQHLSVSASCHIVRMDNAGICSHGNRPPPISCVAEHFIFFMAARYGYPCRRNHFINCFSQALMDVAPGQIDLNKIMKATSTKMEQSDIRANCPIQVPVLIETLRRNLIFFKPHKVSIN